MKSKIYEICHDVMISYVEAVIKKLRMFKASCHVHCLQTGTSPRKFERIEKDPVRFVNNVRDNLLETFSNFYHNVHI
jgi:hypothetical protein